MKLSKDDKHYEIKLSTLNTEKVSLYKLLRILTKKKKEIRKKTLYHYLERQKEACRNNKIKRLIDFDEEYVSSVKSLAIKKETKVNLTTRFLNGKMLMFSKTSIQTFIYNLIDVFMFPDDVVKKISKTKNEIQNCFLFQNVTDTDSTSLFFIFICKLPCSINKKAARNIIFEVLTKSKVLNRLDLSDDFWEQFNVQNKSLKKQVGLYEVENISNTNILTITINPKEYFQKYKDFSISKKHKALKKNTPGIDFEAHSERLATLHEYCFESKPKKIEQKRFQIISDSIQMKSVKKTQFAGLNDKRFYFHDGIVSLPFGHFFC